MKKSIFIVTLLVLVAVFALVDPAIAQPSFPAEPNQAPVGIALLASISAFAIGIFALRKKK